MKKRYAFTPDERFEADLDDLHRLLDENRQYLANYEEVFSSLDDDDYVARGNGFCDRKYSDDFLQLRIAQLTARAAQLEAQTKNSSSD